MKKLALTVGAALGAALLVLGVTPAATAYPEQTCTVSVDRQQVYPGETFTAYGQVSGVDAANQPLPSSAFRWSFQWNGVTKERTGASVKVSFKAPKVSRSRTITLTARSSSAAGDCVRHIDVTVVNADVSPPKSGGGSGGGLPGTGGPEFWILVAGLVLVVGGGGAMAASRRRHG
jgi:LPXTG-motif cell wall-anchored protein